MRLLSFIVARRKPEVYLPCVDFVLRTCPDCDVFILNNGRDPAEFSADLFRHQRVTVTHSPIDIGHPCGVNLGIHHAVARGYEFFLKLDDDASILTEDWYPKCLQTMSLHPKVALIGTKVLAPDAQTVQWGYLRALPDGTWHGNVGEPRHNQDLNKVAHACVVPTTFLFARMEHIRKIGYFDILFSPSQMEDFDYSFRAWAAGFSCVYDGRIEVVHHNLGAADNPSQRLQWAVHVYAMDLKYNKYHRFGLQIEEAIDKLGRLLPPQS